jgi:hypothetical protein
MRNAPNPYVCQRAPRGGELHSQRERAKVAAMPPYA